MAFAILGFVIESVSETTYDDFVKREILEPLDLSNTTTGLAPKIDKSGFIPANDIWWGGDLGFSNP
jgi:CubicO group peptidase (beta-lactamase class C family)